MHRAVDMYVAARGCVTQHDQALVKMFDERAEELLRILRQLQMPIEMIALRFPFVWGIKSIA